MNFSKLHQGNSSFLGKKSVRQFADEPAGNLEMLQFESVGHPCAQEIKQVFGISSENSGRIWAMFAELLIVKCLLQILEFRAFNILQPASCGNWCWVPESEVS